MADTDRLVERELAALRQRVADAEDTLEAIRRGRVDALVIDDGLGESVYTLESADLPYRQFLEQMGEGALSLDAAGQIVFCNGFLGTLLGLERCALLGQLLERFIAEPGRTGYLRALASVAPDETLRVPATLVAQSDTAFPAQIAVTALGHGAERRYTIVITDLSERERLREVSAAHEAVEAENAAKDHFLAALGHELRSPLGVVLGWTQMLLGQRESLPSHARRGLEAIERSAKLQRTLIEDVLDVARIRAGKLRATLVPLDLSAVVASIVVAFEPKANTRGIALHGVVEPGLGVLGDEARIQQLLQNLLENACKFTESGGSVEVLLGVVAGRAELRVRDSGVGIDLALLPRVFELFRQRSVAKHREGGLGLGLSIAKHISDLHGGAIHAESEGSGRGATFVWQVPLHARTPDDAAPAPERASAPGERALLSGMRILVVDDEEEARGLAARGLRRWGADVVAVDGSAAALARLERERFDAVVSDLLMGAGDGYAFARAVRSRIAGAPPLMAFSNLARERAWESARAAGFHAYLQKPAADEQLARAVAALRAN